MLAVDNDNNRYDLKQVCCLEKEMAKQRLRCGDNVAMGCCNRGKPRLHIVIEKILVGGKTQ